MKNKIIANKPIGKYRNFNICKLTHLFINTFLLNKKNGKKKITSIFKGGGAEIKNEYYLSNL